MASKRAKTPDFSLAAGVDEAGRGCLAGPVVAAAVILPRQIPGLADSKRLSAKKREQLAPLVREAALAWGVGVVWQERIDAVNILRATFEAMAKAAAKLRIAPQVLLIDGNREIPEPVLQNALGRVKLPEQSAIIRGDALIPAISAASILAKTFRDRLMTSLARRWPGYGFEIHKGYGTKAHFAALARLGVCPLHRKTFRGVITQPALL